MTAKTTFAGCHLVQPHPNYQPRIQTLSHNNRRITPSEQHVLLGGQPYSLILYRAGHIGALPATHLEWTLNSMHLGTVLDLGRSRTRDQSHLRSIGQLVLVNLE
jgi:hypothetical protein